MNNEVGLEVFKLPKRSFLERVMLMYKDSLYVIITPWLCAMYTWDRIEEVRKRTESFTKVVQGPKETFTNFFKD